MSLPEAAHYPEHRRYLLGKRLTTGAVTETWLARPLESGGKGLVAMKTVLPHLTKDAEFVRELLERAAAVSQLQHNHLVGVLDFGRVDETYYIASEYVNGCSLAQLQDALREQGKITPPWLVVGAALAVCRALEYAATHKTNETTSGLIHGEVTPEDVVISFSGVTRLLGLELGQLSFSQVSSSPWVKGKTRYFAPEQLASDQSTDGRSDVYAIGVILYELLTGQPPYDLEDRRELLETIQARRPAAPGELAPWVPSRLSDVVLRALEPEPEQRQAGIGELTQELNSFFGSLATGSAEAQIAQYLYKLFGPQPAIEDRESVFDDGRVLESLSLRAMAVDGFAGVEAVLAQPPLRSDDSGRSETRPADPKRDEAASGRSAPSPTGMPRDAGQHAWDVITSTRRHVRSGGEGERAESERSDGERVSAWDSALARLRTAKSSAEPAGDEPSARELAEQFFVRGLTLTRENRHKEAYEMWREAADLDPDNRLYQRNLTRLQRLISQQEDDGRRSP